MKYIDSGTGNPTDALAYWLKGVLTSEVMEARWQTGYFTADSLGLFLPTLERLKKLDASVIGVVGSNHGRTLRDHVAYLAGIMGVPRTNAFLGVLRFAGGLYHPKTYHFVRGDGSQAAYVGSANFTYPGIASLNIEAGILVDSRDGDPISVLSSIAAAVDAWISRAGVTQINDPATPALDALVAQKILAAAPPPPPPPPPAGAVSEPEGTVYEGPAYPLLKPLFPLPPSGMPAIPSPALPTAGPVAQVIPAGQVAVKAPFPQYMLFAPGASTPTSGASALSGASLASGAVGLILRLNKDSARHFHGGQGTSNISIPVPSIGTIRFGLYNGKYERPRAEFDLKMRYVAANGGVWRVDDQTNIMAYGFLPGESGNQDVRMVVPAAVRGLRDAVAASGSPVPQVDDYAFLEWPSALDPSFGLTFLEKGSALFTTAEQLFLTATANDQLVGVGACWLPPQLAPSW